jgi:hypothetical protein
MKPVQVEKTATRTVSFWVDVPKEIDVTTYKQVEKTGVREVAKCVPVEKIVKVPVYAPAPAVSPCGTAAPYATSASPCAVTTGHTRGGLFAGRGHGHGCCK